MITVRVSSQGVADSLKVPGLPMLVAPVKHQTGKGGRVNGSTYQLYSDSYQLPIHIKICNQELQTFLPLQEVAAPSGGAWRDDHSLAHIDPRVSEDNHTVHTTLTGSSTLRFKGNSSVHCD